MDIFILSNLEILKKVLKKMCNLHIVTATYFHCILNILTDDKRSCKLYVFFKRIDEYSNVDNICIGIYQHNFDLLFYL